MAYEQTNNYVLMFGGCQLPENFTEATPGCEWGSLLGDTWAWIPAPVGSGNAPAGTWSQVWLNGVQCGGPSQNACASGLFPSPRFGEGLADSYPWNESIYMFGGCARVGTYSGSCALGDTWSFTLGSITFCPANCPVGGGGYVVNGSWSQVPIRGSDCGGPLPGNGIPDPCPSGSAPVPRWGLGFGNLGLGFDGVLFGGCGSSVSANSGCGSSYLYGDTWKFDGAWSQLALFPVGQNLVVCGGPGQRSCGSYSPSPRYYPGFASISSGDACLFGGTSGIASGSQVATADLWVMSYYTSTELGVGVRFSTQCLQPTGIGLHDSIQFLPRVTSAGVPTCSAERRLPGVLWETRNSSQTGTLKLTPDTPFGPRRSLLRGMGCL